MGVKISELSEAISVQNEDLLAIVQNGETKKVTKKILTKEIYSTEEISVGIWVDGNAVYRKVFISDNTSNINADINPDNIIKMTCMTHQTVGSWRTIPWLYSLNDTTGNGSWTGGFYFNDSDSTIRFQLGSNLANLDKIIVIVEYTKNTN